VVQESALAKAVAELCLGGTYDYEGVSYPTVDLWGLYLNRDVWKLVLRELVARFESLSPSCDMLCPVPTSGFAIAGELYALCSIPLMASCYPPDQSSHVHDELAALAKQLGRPVRVCLVDSVIHEGTSLYVASAMLEGAIHAEVVGALCVADNDLIPESELSPLKRELMAAGRLHSVFRVSQLR
jgi:orotate phosphoribosyltransferase